MRADEAHLWLADPDRLSPADEARLGAAFDDVERRRAARFRFDVHRRQFVAAHALARRALGHHAARPAASWRFRLGPHGRPEIEDPPVDLRFNISHTAGLVACLVGPQAELGVDVEHLDRGGRLLDVAQRFFSPREVQALRRLPHERQPARFLDYWTLKEAYIKARGLGLALPLGQFSFLLDGPGTVRVAFDPELGDDPGRWRFTLDRHGSRHVAATAVSVEDGQAPQIVVRDGDALLRE